MINVPGLLNELGIHVDHVDNKPDGAEYWALCPHHFKGKKVDRNPGWSINGETGVHHCFSCGFAGTAWFLVYKALGCDWDDAGTIVGKYQNRLAELLEMDPWDASRPAPVQRLPINEARLLSFDEAPAEALAARHLTPDAAQAYGVRWNHKAFAWITPIRDPQTADLWGWQMKGAEPGSRLFRNYPFGVKKSETLFGYHLDTTESVVVVESPLDAVRLHALGYAAVSTYGAKVSSTQFELLIARYDALVVAMDHDDAGAKASLDFLTYARRIPMRFFHYGDSDAKDVGDMTDDEIEFGMENAVHALWGRRAIGL